MNINSIGMLINMIGVVILYIYANPYRGRGSYWTSKETVKKDKEEQDKLRKNQRLGLIIIGIGFFFQFVNSIGYDFIKQVELNVYWLLNLTYFWQGVGVFLGIIIGTIVNILVNNYILWTNEKQLIANIKFELGFNIKKIETFLSETEKYRNAVNGDSINAYYGYFDLSKVIFVALNTMFISGKMYKYLDNEDIGRLLAFFSEFSLNGENYINNQISQNKMNCVKQKAISDVNFWEKKFNDSKKVLENILEKLK